MGRHQLARRSGLDTGSIARCRSDRPRTLFVDHCEGRVVTEADADAAIVARDAHTCQHCGTTETASSALTPWSIDPRPIQSSMVTVCQACRDLLEGAEPTWRSTLARNPGGSLFALLETTTETQGATVAAVARLATETTGGLEVSDESSKEAYLAARREIYLALTVVDRHLDALAESRTEAGEQSLFERLDPPVRSNLETVLQLTRTLGTHLRTAVTLAETVVVADGFCQRCLAPIAEQQTGGGTESNAADRCDSCSNERRAIAEWVTADGDIDRTSLYRTLSRRLEAAGETTTQLTDETGTLANQLTG